MKLCYDEDNNDEYSTSNMLLLKMKNCQFWQMLLCSLKRKLLCFENVYLITTTTSLASCENGC